MSESVLMMWINLEPIIQSEVSQKEKDKYHILTHIYRIQKNGTEVYLQGNNGETDIENRLMDMERREERVRCMERVIWKLTLPSVKQKPMGIGALYQPRGVEWGGRWQGVSKGRGYMHTYD